MGIIASENQTNVTGDGSALNHFNWGAFCFDWIWGLANGCLGKMKGILIVYLICLAVSIIPLLNLIVWIIALIPVLIFKIYYGMKGNEWAYDGRAFYNEDDFRATQKRWNIAAAVAIALFVINIIITLVFWALLAAFIGQMGMGGVSPAAGGFGGASSGAAQTKLVVEDIITGEKTNGKFASGPAAVNYLLENSSFIKSQSYVFKASKYSANSFKMYMESNPDMIMYLFLVKKEANCELSKKNCYVTRYNTHMKGDTPKVAERVYFDNSGKTKVVTSK